MIGRRAGGVREESGTTIRIPGESVEAVFRSGRGGRRSEHESDDDRGYPAAAFVDGSRGLEECSTSIAQDPTASSSFVPIRRSRWRTRDTATPEPSTTPKEGVPLQ